MAGKKRKEAERNLRKALKRKKKDSEKAKYESWRDAGTNGKSKRSKIKGKKSKTNSNKHKHLTTPCGNHGCDRCTPRVSMFFRRNPGLMRAER